MILGRKFPFVNIILRGLGQIMLQENAMTGLFFLIGIFAGSLWMGMAAILSVCCGTLAAKLLGYDKDEIEKGLYGFSAALVGVALILFFEPVFIVWLSIIIGSIAAAMLQHFFIVKKIPVFTLPFVVVTWAILYMFHNIYPVEPSPLLSSGVSEVQDFTFAFRSFGEVIFQGGLFAGIIFFIGVYINSPVSALCGIVGAILAAVFSFWLGAPITSIAMGLLSYNAVLCSIVFAGDKVKDGIWILISVALSVLIYILMNKSHLTVLTFPFVAATCISLVLKNVSTKISGSGNRNP